VVPIPGRNLLIRLRTILKKGAESALILVNSAAAFWQGWGRRAGKSTREAARVLTYRTKHEHLNLTLVEEEAMIRDIAAFLALIAFAQSVFVWGLAAGAG
jgi:hypothetical protein